MTDEEPVCSACGEEPACLDSEVCGRCEERDVEDARQHERDHAAGQF